MTVDAFLRLTWAGEDENDYLVLDQQENIIGRIYRELSTSQGRWLFFVGPGNLPRRADFHGYVESLRGCEGALQRAMAAVS